MDIKIISRIQATHFAACQRVRKDQRPCRIFRPVDTITVAGDGPDTAVPL